MALKNYILNGPSVVTGGRTPAQSWQWHLDNTGGTRGGVDLVAATGTPVLAPTNGTLIHLPDNGGAGNSCEFRHDDNPGWADVFSHLSAYVGVSGRRFNQGDVIAYSGATGGNYAPHLHRHLLKAGVRYNPWNYFSTNTTPPPTPTPEELFGENMPVFLKTLSTSTLPQQYHLLEEFNFRTFASTADATHFGDILPDSITIDQTTKAFLKSHTEANRARLVDAIKAP